MLASQNTGYSKVVIGNNGQLSDSIPGIGGFYKKPGWPHCISVLQGWGYRAEA